SSVLVNPPAVPHLPLNAGGLAVLAIAIVLFLVAGIWTVFVAGIWTTRTRHERERERQREYALDLAINNISCSMRMRRSSCATAPTSTCMGSRRRW
ncbi:MAG: hypothetical protein WCD67_06990, partial [Xanthobacteraceae bacterium]